jgi:aspartate kinase
MKTEVYKFGGASVKDAEGVMNASGIITAFSGGNLLVVISAMGKITNSLEKLLDARIYGEDWKPLCNKIFRFHRDIIDALRVSNPRFSPSGYFQLEQDFAEELLLDCSPEKYDRHYDRIVAYGELWSTAIVSEWVAASGLNPEWLDARDLVITDETHRFAEVNWQATTQSCAQLAAQMEEVAVGPGKIVITQGFIGRSLRGEPVTLGREGSDYSASVFAYVLDANAVTIWKDVPGMLNADPRWYPEAVKLSSISYREAIELSYYGASVIHPKTVQPLQQKQIPLYIKSFLCPEEQGTVIQADDSNDHLVPSFIHKGNQWLISLSSRSFSFIVESQLRQIFEALGGIGMKISLMQNSAISFTFCTDGDQRKFDLLTSSLGTEYHIRYNSGLELLTIRHYNSRIIAELLQGREILLEQRSRSTARFVLRSEIN